MKYSQYSTSLPPFGDLTPTVPSAQVAKSDRLQKDASEVTAQIVEPHVIAREERVEYRDQDGHLLNDEQVQSLLAEGKATFQTKYETRTRLVDEHGNEISGDGGVAPDHPDVQGQNPDTKGILKAQGQSQPADVEAGKSAKKGDEGKAKPASDATEATK